jgi:hypothetical protein
MAHPRPDSIWPSPYVARPTPAVGSPIGDVVAIMATSADAGRAVAMLAALGIAETSIEMGESPREPAILVVRRPGRERIAEIRSVLLADRVRRARYYRMPVIEELVRVSGRWSQSANGRSAWST